jgi:DNA polymerase-3 subunit gamma/tau
LIARDAAGSLAALDRAVAEGVDLGQLAEQLLGYLRDLLACGVGCKENQLLHAGPSEFAAMVEAAQRWGVETILAAAQILDESIVRMRQSVQTRTLLEVALVRICRLEDLDNLASLIAGLRSGAPPTIVPPRSTAPSRSPTPPAEAKTSPPRNPSSRADPPHAGEPVGVSEPAPQPIPQRVLIALDSQSADRVWKQALDLLGDMTSECAAMASRVAIPAPNRLVVSFPAGYNYQKETCERPERKQRLEEALAEVTGSPVKLDFELLAGERKPATTAAPPTPVSHRQLMQRAIRHPLVSETLEMFDGEIVRVDQGAAARTATEVESEEDR